MWPLGGPKIWGTRARPLGMRGVADCRAKFGRSRSNDTMNVLSEIRRENMDHCVIASRLLGLLKVIGTDTDQSIDRLPVTSC